mmetsp:Transcript_48300/g.154241  ORF Transcript_48300/g.154241 Transcript_48300/m.154241 type:complete len:223 (+) Transcript_48300:564-1232(+)
MQVKTRCWMRLRRHCSSRDSGCRTTSDVRRLMLVVMWPPTQSRPRTSTVRICSRCSGSLSSSASFHGSTISKRVPRSCSTCWSAWMKETAPVLSCVGEFQRGESSRDCETLLRELSASLMFLKDTRSSFSSPCSSSDSPAFSFCFRSGARAGSSVPFFEGAGPTPPMASIEALRIRLFGGSRLDFSSAASASRRERRRPAGTRIRSLLVLRDCRRDPHSEQT